MLSLFVVVSIFLCSMAMANDNRLVACSYSDRYHIASCKIAKKIHPDDLVVYSTPEEADAAGLVPCKKCDPPVAKGKEKKERYSFSSKSKETDDPDQES